MSELLLRDSDLDLLASQWRTDPEIGPLVESLLATLRYWQTRAREAELVVEAARNVRPYTPGERVGSWLGIVQEEIQALNAALNAYDLQRSALDREGKPNA